MTNQRIFAGLATISLLFAGASAQGTCNPMISAIGACSPNTGLPTSTYYIDFTEQTALPANWTIANYETVSFGNNGAEFTFAKRYDSPQMWTDFSIFFGSIETVMQVAPGVGIISSAVLISDDLDEIDWELSGNNFNLSTTGLGQNNYYGKGITGNYDRGQYFTVASPQTQFHTYRTDWTPEQVTWSVDGVVVRTLTAAACLAEGNNYQFPQTPMKLQLGMWDGGDPDGSWGTVDWAGGYTDLSLAPFTMYVKSVSIVNANPAYAYNWTDQTGSEKSIQLLQGPVIVDSKSATSMSATSLAPSVSSSVMSSALSSLGAQFAGTTTGKISLTASIVTTSTLSKASTVPSASSSMTSSATSKTTGSTSSKTSTVATSTVRSSTTSSKTTSSCTSKIVSATTIKVSTPTSSSKKPVYTPYWHYWRDMGHWVRGWW